MSYLTDEQIGQFKDAFSLFDQDQDGLVSVKELGRMLQYLGQNPSQSEVNEMINDADLTVSSLLNFPTFLIMMDTKLREIDSEEEIRSSFGFIDKVKMK